jgi:hypothetical protein
MRLTALLGVEVLYEPREARTVRVGCVGVLVEDLLHVASTPGAVSMEFDELT